MLTSFINKNAESAGHIRLSPISRSNIKNILDAAEIKPHKIKYYCEKRDPDFETKMYDVLDVYRKIKKPDIQAIGCTSPTDLRDLEKVIFSVIMSVCDMVHCATGGDRLAYR